MSTSINWGRLYAQGRCKDVGVPWTEPEAKARAEGVPADYVRKGVLSLDAYEKALAADRQVDAETGTVPLDRLKKAQLLALAADHGLQLDPDAVTKEILVRQLIELGLPERLEKSAIPAVKEEE